MNSILASWSPDQASFPLGNFVQDRMDSLKIGLMDAGLISGEKNAILPPSGEEPEACAEAGILLGEAIWRVKSIVGEIRRRWPEIDGEADLPKYASVRKWIRDVERILSS